MKKHSFFLCWIFVILGGIITFVSLTKANNALAIDKWVPFTEMTAQIENYHSKTPNVAVIHSREDQLKLKLTTPGMSVEDTELQDEGYKIINLGRYNGGLPSGQPNLPCIRKYVAVPFGKSVSVTITSWGDPLIFDNYLVFPIQQPQIDSEENAIFQIDEDIYQENAWLPKKSAYCEPIEMIRGRSICLLNICPFQYNPSQRLLKAFPEIEVEVNFIGKREKIDPRLLSPVFTKAQKAYVLNPGVINEDTSSYLTYSKSDGIYSNSSIVQGVEDSTDSGAEYLIITAPEFEIQANLLRDWKMSKGIVTVVKTTHETGSSQADIKAYIQNAYDSWLPAPVYVLLLGDVETIPTCYETIHPYEHQRIYIGTDLYYSTTDGIDFIPDILLGRISVDTAVEAETVIQKIINYEQNPPTLPSFYTNAMVAGYFQDDLQPYGFEDRRFIRTCEEVRDYLLGKGYDVERVYCANSWVNPTNYNNGGFANGEPLPTDLLRANGFAWDGNAQNIINSINNGISLVLHRDHGADRNAGYSYTGWSDPYFNETHIPYLNNGENLPVILSFNCMTGWYDGETDDYTSRSYESFAELMLRKQNGGAIGVIASSRVSYSGYNDFLAEGMIDCVWPDFLPKIPNSIGPCRQLGQMLLHGKLTMDELWGSNNFYCRIQYELFNLHGDPSLEMYTAEDNTSHIYFKNQVVTSGIYEAEFIIADQNVTITSGSTVTFKARDSIIVRNNFIIEEDANVTFEALSITAENTFIIRSGAKVFFKASESITAGPNFIIESGAEVLFLAGNLITLLPEFTAHQGCLFTAINENDRETKNQQDKKAVPSWLSAKPSEPLHWSLMAQQLFIGQSPFVYSKYNALRIPKFFYEDFINPFNDSFIDSFNFTIRGLTSTHLGTIPSLNISPYYIWNSLPHLYFNYMQYYLPYFIPSMFGLVTNM